MTGAEVRVAEVPFAEIFQKQGLHEFLTEFIADNTRLGATITDQYLT